MKRFIIFLILISFFSTQLTTDAHSKGAFFREIIKLFKGSANNTVKTGDDLLKNMGKNSEAGEALSNPLKELKKNEVKILKTHSSHFNSLKNETRESFISKIDNLAEFENIFDLEELESNISLNLTNADFNSLVIINWNGKAYKNSEYFSNPNLEEKMLLVCSDSQNIFYFSLFMEKEPKRAFLVEHKSLNNELKTANIKNILPQELLVLEDSEKFKIMSTFPEKRNNWPSNYFTIYNNQYFDFDRKNGSVGISNIKIKTVFPQTLDDSKFKRKAKCRKATNKGLS